MESKDIEILDLDEDVKVSEVKDDTNDIEDKKTAEVKESKRVNKRVKKRRLKKGLFQTIFCLLSFSFIVGCCIFYGSRLIKYYKIYNPKTESGETVMLISNAIAQESPIVLEGEGLYRENGVYVYKGAEVNNYVKYSNMIWRVVRTNGDGSIEIILDDYINILAWDFEGNEYVKSDLHKYLNDIFVEQINTDLLVNTSICTDKMPSIDKYSCNNRNTEYFVKLLPANDFLNSVIDEKTYIADEEELVWLGTTANDEKAWLANGSSISTSEDNNTYFVKPVVTLKNSTQLVSGNGSKEEPFVVEKESKEIAIGSYITLGEDTWVVTSREENQIKLVYSDLYNDGLTTYRFDTEKLDFNPERANSLANLLNTDFYDSLTYKDMLLDFDVYTATYTGSYKNTYEEKVTVKVGIPSAVDLKFNNEADGYYLSSKSPRENRIYYYKKDLISSKPGMSRPYRPTIMIEVTKVSGGNGSIDNPFKVEV